MDRDKVVVERIVGKVGSSAWGYDAYVKRKDDSFEVGDFIAWFEQKKAQIQKLAMN